MSWGGGPWRPAVSGCTQDGVIVVFTFGGGQQFSGKLVGNAQDFFGVAIVDLEDTSSTLGF